MDNSKSIQTIVGSKLTSITFIFSYLQLGFSNGSGLTINNKYHWSTKDYPAIIGSEIMKVLEDNEEIVFEFSNKEKLVVGFKSEDFLSPDGEGMLLYLEGANTPIIWDENYAKNKTYDYAGKSKVQNQKI